MSVGLYYIKSTIIVDDYFDNYITFIFVFDGKFRIFKIVLD